MRVHELAKELNMGSKVLVAELKDMGIEVKSHMSTISDEDADRYRRQAETGSRKKPASKKTAAAAKKKTAKEQTKKTSRAASPAPAAQPDESSQEEADQDVPATVVEKRLSGTVIRRRKKAAPPPRPEQTPEPIPDTAEAPPSEQEAAKESEITTPPEDQSLTAQPEPAADTQPEAAQEKAEPAPKIKKISLREKEVTPARTIGRIELPGKEAAPQEAEQKPVQEAAEQPKQAERIPSAEEPDKQKKAAPKAKGKRKKFRWQTETIDEDETTVEPAPQRQKRVHYRVKDKSSGKQKKHRTEIISLDRGKEPEKTVPKAIKRKIRIQDGISVADLAKKMGIKASEIVKKLFDLGVMATINQFLDSDTAALVAHDYEYEIETVSVEEEIIFDQGKVDEDHELQPRSPVVTVMGHVDHGKTSLLDAIRETNIVDGEKGGITQHIGAYLVSVPEGDIVFVDTPGHAAFTTMRARGAGVTDIVILVVAADEGVKPQTLEAINHAKAGGVPIIVAVNKIDKPEANTERVRQELSNYGLVAEEWGGEAIFVEVSAKQKQGLDKLLEMVLLQAEVLELKANPDKQARGTILESRLDKHRGPVATVLVQEGTLRTGDSFVSRDNFGKVKAMIDDRGRTLEVAPPATPVEILGFSSVPEAGDVFLAVDERKARQTSLYWQQKKREEGLKKDSRISLETFLQAAGDEETKELRLIIKADVHGSVEALRQSLEGLSTDEIKVTIIHESVGAVSPNDVMLASASGAIIIGFGVKTDVRVMETAEQENVDIRLYGVIYDIIDEVKKAMVGMLAPKYVEKISGKAEVRQVFDISKYGTVAGCFVIEGKVVNGSQARVLRAKEKIHEGAITSLKRYKDDTKEVPSGQDCGIFLGTYHDFAVGDIIESFFLEEVERTL